MIDALKGSGPPEDSPQMRVHPDAPPVASSAAWALGALPPPPGKAAAPPVRPARGGAELDDTEAIFRAHGAEVSRWLRALAGPDADVEDLLQDVFLVVHRARRGFRGDSALTTWLFGITSNLVRRHRRVQKLKRWLGGTAVEVAGALPADGPLADELLARQQAQRRVYQVLDRLSEKFRDALILFELEGHSAAQIAELYGVTPSVVWVWLHRARTKFHQELSKLEATEGRA